MQRKNINMEDNEKKQCLYGKMETLLQEVESIVGQIKESGISNEQYVLDWLDNLNKLSINC